MVRSGGRSLVLALVLATPAASVAQPAGTILSSEAKAGDRITVTTTTGERFKGRLLSDRAGTLVVTSRDGERTIPHADIDRVTRRSNRFFLGPLIGLGAGYAVGKPLATRFDNEGANGDAILAISIGLGVITGTVIDLGNGSERTIYKKASAALSGLQLLPVKKGAAVRWAIAW